MVSVRCYVYPPGGCMVSVRCYVYPPGGCMVSYVVMFTHQVAVW